LDLVGLISLLFSYSLHFPPPASTINSGIYADISPDFKICLIVTYFPDTFFKKN